MGNSKNGGRKDKEMVLTILDSEADGLWGQNGQVKVTAFVLMEKINGRDFSNRLVTVGITDILTIPSDGKGC